MVMGALFLFFLVPCVEAELCYNGGTFDGIKCICDENLYYGPKCEFLVHEGLNGTPSTSTLVPSSYNSRSTVSSTPIPEITSSPKISKRTTTIISTSYTAKSTSKTANTGTIIASSTITTTTSQLCYNGGTFDGIKCICDENLYYGPKCEFLVHEGLNGTPSTSTLVPSSYNSRSTVSSTPIPEITSSPKISKRTTTIISTSYTAKSTSKTANTGTIIASSTITTTTSQICYNGGTYDGLKCICNEDLFYGPKCEFLLDEIPVTQLSVTITVEVQVKVTNREFKKSLEDLSSNYYREIQTQFKKQMKDVYGAVPRYHDVEILRMRNGSIIVEHRVISKVLAENNQELIQRLIKIIIEAVERSLNNLHTEGECIDPSGPELCFVPLPNSTLIPGFSLNDTCKNITDTKYADYYYPYIRNGTVSCISRCFSGTEDSMNCFNGVCRLSEIGPHCICNNLDMFWYLDSYCRLPIQKTVLGLSLALAVFFVLSIILVICLIKAKRKKSRNSRSDGANCDKIGQRNPIFQE